MKPHFILALLFTACLQASPPTPTRHVTDKAGALTPLQIDNLDKALVDYEARTTNQLIIYIDKSLNGANLDDTIQWCHDWGIGQKGKDNGAALFLFINDRKSAIRTGYGMEASLPDATCKVILDGMKGDLREKRYGVAVGDAINKMMSAMDGTVGPIAFPATSSDGPSGWMIFFIVVGVIGAAAVVVFLSEGGKGSTSSGASFRSGGDSSSSSSRSSSSSYKSSGFRSGGGRFGGGGAGGSW